MGTYMGKEISLRTFTESQSRWATIKEVRVTSGVPQGGVLSHLLLLAYVNDIW